MFDYEASMAVHFCEDWTGHLQQGCDSCKKADPYGYHIIWRWQDRVLELEKELVEALALLAEANALKK
jgi:hypothetical protein